MSHLYDWFIEPLTYPYFVKALLAGSLVAIVCGVIGCFIILRRMAFLGDALAHAMLAGVVAGYLFMQVMFGVDAHGPAMVVGSIFAGLITVGLIGFVSRVSRVKEDTAIGIMYTGIFAAGGMLASIFSDIIHVDLLHFIMGQVLAVQTADLWMMAFVAGVVIFLVILFYRQLQLTSFDPTMAASIGVPVLAVNYMLTTCTSLVVVSGVQIVGVVLVVGLLITPAASAYLLCDRLSRMLCVAALFGVTSVVGGVYVSEWISVATGSSIVVFGTVQFMVVLFVAPRYGLIAGWLRRRSMVPQRLIEDVLDWVRRSKQQPVPEATLLSHVSGQTEAIRRALYSLRLRELLTVSAGRWQLTDEGQHEAKRLMRAHRLWETYMDHVGMPQDELHDAANRMEHVHDEEVVDYLDDKLGHPLTDPHGAEIPEDFVHLVPGHEVKLALLREGHRGRITKLAFAASDLPLVVDMVVIVGQRRDAGRTWTVMTSDGQEVALDHQAADAVTVELRP